MLEVPVYEAKTRLSELLAAVERGEQVTITRRGTPVARLVPAAAGKRRAAASEQRRVREAIDELKRLRKGVTLDISWREAIDYGRD